MKGTPRTPAPHPLSLAVRKGMGGVSLVELLLVAGVVVAGAAVVLSVASSTQAQSKRAQAQSDITEFHSRLISSYQHKGNFEDLTTASALADNLFPKEMLDPTSGQPVTPWGGAISVSGTSRNGGIAGSSMAVTMERVPAADCTATATALSAGFSEVVVNEISVGAGRNLDVGQLSEACSGREESLIQLYWDNPNATQDLGSCSSTTETQVLTCPPGQLGSITQSRLLSCPTMYDPAVPGPWTEVSNTCAPMCVLPTPPVQTETRPGGSCPVGQLGEIIESRTATYVCPAPTGSPTVSYSPWAESSNTCAPICSAPAPQTHSRTLACPTGQLGQIDQERVETWTCPAPTGPATSTMGSWVEVANTCAPVCVAPPTETWTETKQGRCVSPRITPTGSSSFNQTRQGTITFSCPAPTGDYTASPASFTSWTPTESQACAQPCVLPSPNPQVDSEDRVASQVLACPSGQLGEIVQTRDERRSRTRTASCPTPVGSVSWSNWSSWSAWQGVSSWQTKTNSCAPACVVPTPATQTRAGTPQTRTVTEDRTITQTQAGPSETRTQNSCPAGQYGVYNQTRTTTQTRSATQTRTQPQERSTTQSRTASCPAPTGPVAWTPWSAPGAPYGNWANSGPASAWSAPKAPYTPWSAPGAPYGNWTTTSNTCKGCPAPSVIDDQLRWNGTYTQSCPAGQLGVITRERQQARKLTRSYNCPAGTSSLPAPTDTWSAWANNGTTRLVSNTCAPACVLPNPVTETRAGTPQTRSITESQTVTQTQAGTPQTRTQNLCPAGQYGVHNQSRTTTQSRTATQTRSQPQSRTTTQSRTASCPAPTGPVAWSAWSAPGAPYGSWTNSGPAGSWSAPKAPYGAWSSPGAPYGSWTTTSNTCKGCPAPSISDTQSRWYGTYTQSCSSGQYGIITREREQERKQTKSYNCPAGTSSLPSPSYSWSSWANNGTTRLVSNTCKGCPAATTESQTRWVEYTSYNCPAGQYGSNQREREQKRTRTKSYSCPAGTTSLPPPSYTPWSSYSNTGTTRDLPGTDCKSCPAPAHTDTQWRWYGTYTQNCPSGQTGIITRERQQERKQTRTYTCPSGTRTLPTPTYSWGGWYNNGTTRLVSNTCAPACSPRQETETELITCPYPQSTTMYGSRKRTVYWTCPGPKKSYGSWTVISHPQCCPAGRICQIQ